MTEEIHPNWFKMCVAGKLCPGANNGIDSQARVTLREQTGAATQTPFSLLSFPLGRCKLCSYLVLKLMGDFEEKNRND